MARTRGADLIDRSRGPGGLACGWDMLRATGEVNTHKGSIFALGLLCAPAGRLAVRRCGQARTAGEHLFRRYGMAGAPGEAASGFATGWSGPAR